ncbi:MAG: sel1 repeat family protein [Elusimicrobium sp.]|jgi:TPR repeat protein|nr:sel1 repeat family protein [Elusimicrobium sp.]
MKKIVIAFIAAVIILPLLYVFFARPSQPAQEPAPVPETLRPVLAAADKGDVQSQYIIGKAYFYGGQGLHKNFDKGLYYMKKAAAVGGADALYELALAYKYGKGAPMDYNAALDNFKKAAEGGSSASMLEIARIYDEAKQSAAREWFEKAANAGEAEAIKKMADISCSVPKPAKDCAAWLQKAADINSVEHIKQLAKIYEDGVIAPQSKKDALSLYVKAAELGDVSSMSAAGYSYTTGSLAPRDNKLAYEWTLKAAQGGNVESMYNLALMLYDGKIVVQDKDAALAWFIKAAQSGNNQAAYRAGLMYAEKQNFKDAAPLLTQAARAQIQGAAGSLAKAMLAVQNYKDALEWANKGVKTNDANAMAVLGYLYANGLGIDQDTQQCLNWYGQAMKADPQNGTYMYNIANCFARQGEYDKSVYWLKQAAEHGSKTAMFKLAELYREGRGVKKDEKLAAQWGTSAAAAKDDEWAL